MPGGRPGAPGVDAAKALPRRQLEQARPGQPSRTGRSPRAWEAHGRCRRPWREGHYAAAAHAVDEAADLAAAYATPYASSALGDGPILLSGWGKRQAWMQGVQGVMVRDFCRNRFHLVLISPARQTPRVAALAQAAFAQRVRLPLQPGEPLSRLLAAVPGATEPGIARCDGFPPFRSCRGPPPYGGR
jgi:hypothetical protein